MKPRVSTIAGRRVLTAVASLFGSLPGGSGILLPGTCRHDHAMKGRPVPSDGENAPRRRRLPAEERRRQIVEAVLDVVAEHGISGTTVARIAEAAGVSEGTLYVYFQNREEMLTAALDRIFARMADLIDSSTESDALSRLRDIAERHADVMRTERQQFTSPWIEFIAAGPQAGLREAIAQTQTRAFAKMLSIVQQGQADGTIRSDIDARRITWQWYTAIWAENLSSLMGLNEYIDAGHSAYSVDLMLRDAAAQR
jgi:AcrR family transcriptional regulator